MAGSFLQEVYLALIERDSKGNIISREEMDERHVNFTPRVGEIISRDTLEFYQDEEGCNEQTEDGRDYVRVYIMGDLSYRLLLRDRSFSETSPSMSEM